MELIKAGEQLRSEDEQEECTFTPNIGKKGIIFESIKFMQTATNHKRLRSGKDPTAENLESTGGSFKDMYSHRAYVDDGSVTIRTDLLRPSDRFFDDMIESAKRKEQRLEQMRKKKYQKVILDRKYGVFKDALKYRIEYKSRARSSPRSI